MNGSHVIPIAKELLQKVVKPNDIVVDATVGNGHDTLFLAKLVGSTGLVYGFDVQIPAIEATKNRLLENKQLQQTQLFLKDHANLKEWISLEHHGYIKAAIFNLGYLPGSDKRVITTPDSTIPAVKGLLEILTPGGLIVLVIYHQHEGGKQEKDALMAFLEQLNQAKAHVLKYQFLNQKNNPPFLITVQKR